MSNLRQAAEAALEALEGNPISHAGLVNSKRAIVALRDALENGFNPDWDAMAVMVEEQMCMAKRIAELEAQTEQEPVAWMYDFLNTDNSEEVIRNWVTQDFTDIAREKGFNVRPLYTAPPQRLPLTDEEIDLMTRGNNYPGTVPGARRFARAIEAAHGIKGEV